MKKWIFPIMIVAIAAVLYEQSKTKSNLWIMIAGIVIFMAGMMWLSSKTPSKNQDKDGGGI